MKIRNGFVSNSSSSSFIISANSFESVRALATYMIKKKIEEENYYDEDDGVEIDEYNHNNIYIDRLKNVDENYPVCFPSCSYETYIKKVGDVYLVSTCNNTDWDLHEYTTRLTEKARIELLEIQKKLVESNDDYRHIQYILDNDYDFSAYGNDYYDLREEIIGVEINDNCPNCKSYMWSTKKFGKICLKCNPAYKRKDKLDKINNSISE